MNHNDYIIQKPQLDMHKRKCEELRKIRVTMAKTLGVPDMVRKEPCNFEGECHGICPACYMEERALMDRIYELSKNGVVLTLKESEFAGEQEPLPMPKPPIPYNPPVPPKRPIPPIVQGMIHPMPYDSPADLEPPVIESPVIEPEKKKRGIFDKIKRKE